MPKATTHPELLPDVASVAGLRPAPRVRWATGAVFVVILAAVTVLGVASVELRESGYPGVALAALLAAAGVATTVPIHLWLVRGAAAQVRGLAARLHADRERLRDVAARAFRAQEAERLRVARELQEQTAQELAASMLRLRSARGAADPFEREYLLDQVRDDLARVTDEIRRYARVLRPPALQDLGLVPAIEAYVRSLQRAAPLDVRLHAGAGLARLAPESELALYRIVQEALSNVVRHAGAAHALVTLTSEDGWVEVSVEDDGRGFDPADVERREPCLGLFAMQARALALGGETHVRSTPGAGTELRVRLPLAARSRSERAALPLLPGPPGRGIPDRRPGLFPADAPAAHR